LNPLYDGGVYHAKDASHGAEIIRQLMSETQEKSFVENTQKHYENLKLTYENRQSKTKNQKSKIIDWCPTHIVNPEKTVIGKLQNFPLESLVPLIDWRYFFHAWELKTKGTDEDVRASAEQQKLREDAEVLLKKIVGEKLLTANAAYGVFDTDYGDSRLRGNDAKVCVFACTAGIGVDALVEEFEKSGNTYSALLVQTLADRLAEAFAVYLEECVRHDFFGTDETSAPAMRRVAAGYPSYPDHSKKKELFALINATEITGIELTETFMMTPVASVCGLIFPQ